jgi:sec-independent protein translocase protein TatA
MLGLGMGELLLILAIALLVFGPTKLPQLASGLGKAVRSFKKATSGADEATPPSLDPPQ